MEASTFQSNSLSGSSFKSPQMKSGISHHWHWNTLSEFSDFLMKRHADCQERNLPPGSWLCIQSAPQGPQTHESWVGAIFQGSPEGGNEHVSTGQSDLHFSKKILNSRLSKFSTIFCTDWKKKKWRKLKLKPSLLWWILYDLWDVYCSDEVKYFLRSPRSYMNHQLQKIQL